MANRWVRPVAGATRTATHQPTLVRPVKDVDGWLPFIANRYE
jgi:hypothetical protein